MSQFMISKHGHSRFWAVRDPGGVMVCVCVYKRGASEVVRRLEAKKDSSDLHFHDGLPVEPPRETPETGARPAESYRHG
jgi:hypothetical protein